MGVSDLHGLARMIWLVLIILGLLALSCWEAWTRYQRRTARYRHPISLKDRLP